MKQASFPLPLDLHVLSLSLAFILSQDQTLHCIFSILNPLTQDPVSSFWRLDLLFNLSFPYTTFFVVHSYQRSLLSNTNPIPQICASQTPNSFRAKRTAKLQPFFLITKYFSIFFSLFVSLQNNTSFPQKAVAKVQPFLIPTKHFYTFFWKNIKMAVIQIITLQQNLHPNTKK